MRARDAVQAALLLVAVGSSLAVFWFAHHIVLLGFVAVLIATVFSFPVNALSQVVPRSLAVILVLFALLGLVYCIASAAAPVLSRQADQLQESAPRAIRAVTARLRQFQSQHVAPAAAAAGGEQRPTAGAESQVPQALEVGAKALPALLGLLGGITEVVLVVVLAAFLVYLPDAYRDGLKRLVPRSREIVFDELWDRLRYGLRHWVGGIVVAMTLMGTLAAVGLLIAGIEGWLLLGVLTFLGTFVPYLGAAASAIPGLLAALSQSPSRLVYALIVYIGVHIVEGYIVEPVVMRRAVELNPALLLFGQGLFGALFGVLGVVVATPAIICLQIVVEALWVERRLGKGSGVSMVPSDKAAASTAGAP